MIQMKKYRPAVVLFLVALFAYGLLIPRLGFYWDDLPISWIGYQLGPEALTAYFATSRPVWGVLYQATTRLVPQSPVYWQVIAFALRWACAWIAYLIAARLWRDKPRLALGIALLFLVYPGFDQHFTAYLYSHFYAVLFFFLFSFWCMLRAMESPGRYWAWTIAGMFFSALNLWMTEYFFLLELARAGVILIAIREERLSFKGRVLRGLRLWVPYLAVFTLAVLSRLFIFNNPYDMGLAGAEVSAPLDALRALARNFRVTLRLVLRDAWFKMFELPEIENAEAILRSYYLVVAAVVLVTAAGFLLTSRDAKKTVWKNLLDGMWMIGLGALCLALSGWPFWLIGFTPSLNWPASRFTLPFMLGVALTFAGLIALIPWERARIVILVSLVSMAAGKQYLTARNYVQDWEMQKDLFWQMTWRAPSIEPDTLILMNEGALDYYADNSLSAALNWIYAPDHRNRDIEYVLFYPTTRFRNALPDIEPGLPVHFDYLAGGFDGNTSQALSFYFDPPGCLRLLDPEVERLDRLILENSLMRYAARLTDPDRILEAPRAAMPGAYGPEPEHGFCYYYQKADLARQFGRWDEAAKFSDLALSFEDHPYEPAEHLLFIEGYAHDGRWERAVELSKRVHEVSPEATGRMLCQLWERVEAETASSRERSEALSAVKSMFACNP